MSICVFILGCSASSYLGEKFIFKLLNAICLVWTPHMSSSESIGTNLLAKNIP